MLAKDLKAGQKFTHSGDDEECTAIGVTDYCDDVCYTSRYSGGVEVDYIDGDTEVTLVEEKPATVDPGEGYRLLGPDEKVIKGDEFLGSDGDWHMCMTGVGNRCTHYITETVRRKIAEPVKTGADAGEGYRLLGPDEICREGDEHYTEVFSAKWMPVESGVGRRVGDYAATFLVKPTPRPVRRKIELTYRPYTAEEAAAIVGKVVVYKDDARATAILTGTNPFGEPLIYVGIVLQSMDDLLEKFTFADGSPCGVAE